MRLDLNRSLLCCLLLTSMHGKLFALTTNESYDPLPLYTTQDPHEFLYTSKKILKQGLEPDLKKEHCNITITPFGQHARDANNLNKCRVELGDMFGMWNMLALTYDFCPTQSNFTPLLQQAANTYFCEPVSGAPETLQFGDDNAFTFTSVRNNTAPGFGIVSAPLTYRKFGVRLQTSCMLINDFGIELQAGAADIKQSLIYTTSCGRNCSGFIDQSTIDLPNITDENCKTDQCCVNENINRVQSVLTGTTAIQNIAKELKLDISNFQKTGVEDLRLIGFWRHAIALNKDREGWSPFMLIPFVQIIGTIALTDQCTTDPKQCCDKQFAVPLGNKGHSAAGFNLGFMLDFYQTMEIGIEAGGTFFFQKNELLRFPVHEKQQGILPCLTNACVKPGNNWHAIITAHARHFLDRLSAHVQFAIVSHARDRITVNQPDSGALYLTDVVENNSKWDTRLLNMALNYDISPNIALGILWQAPISRRNCPRSNTLLGSLMVTF